MTLSYGGLFQLLNLNIHLYFSYEVRCGFKNENHKYMCFKEVELCAQNLLTIIGFILNNTMGTCVIT